LRIVDWQKHQGYEKRGPRWIKLYLSLTDQPAYLTLPVVARAVLPVLWVTAARVGEDGELPDDLTMLSRLTHLDEAELSVALQPLERAGFIEFDKVVARAATESSQGQRQPCRERERESRGRERVEGEQTVAVATTSQPPAHLPPEQRAEEATTALIRRQQLRLGALLTQLTEHEANADPFRRVDEWCREVTSYTKPDGSKNRGVGDYRQVQSLDRLERSIGDAEWWLAKLNGGPAPAPERDRGPEVLEKLQRGANGAR
jgi:hypothetical protein